MLRRRARKSRRPRADVHQLADGQLAPEQDADTLAPGVLAEAALCLLFAALGHPGLAAATPEPAVAEGAAVGTAERDHATR